MDVVLLHYPDYERIHSEIHIRIFDLPVHYTLRQLRQSHLNCLVRVIRGGDAQNWRLPPAEVCQVRLHQVRRDASAPSSRSPTSKSRSRTARAASPEAPLP